MSNFSMRLIFLTQTLALTYFFSVPVRLGGIGSSETEGYVEALNTANGQWGGVCDNSFDILDAHVVCKMLGFNTSITAVANSGTNDLYGNAPSGSYFVLDNLDCSGSENSLFDCQLTGELSTPCEAPQIVGVKCSASKLCPYQKTRLGLNW